MHELLRAYKQQIDDSVEFIQAMHRLATVLNEDVNIVTERFNIYVRHSPLSWQAAYSFLYPRAAFGIRDTWIHDPNESEEVTNGYRQTP